MAASDGLRRTRDVRPLGGRRWAIDLRTWLKKHSFESIGF